MNRLQVVNLTAGPDTILREQGLGNLRRWSAVLDILSRSDGRTGRSMLRLVGDMPYVFERNLSRWPDGLWHLVDRGYEDYGVRLSLEQLERCGVVRWDKSRWCSVAFSGDCYALIDDGFDHIATPKALGELGRVLQEVAREARQL